MQMFTCQLAHTDGIVVDPKNQRRKTKTVSQLEMGQQPFPFDPSSEHFKEKGIYALKLVRLYPSSRVIRKFAYWVVLTRSYV